MQASARIGWFFGVGIPLLLLALFFQSVTLASGRYGGILVTALVLIAIADVCFIQAFRRGGVAIRCLSILLLLPTLFVAFDFVQRLPSLFR
jgi:drug/metabolite transporter (DMT)-like permease